MQPRRSALYGQKGGREVGATKLTVSADGNTLNGSFTDMSTSTTGKGSFIETRVGSAPAGAHAVSGQWNPTKLQDVNTEALTFTYRTDGDTLHMSSGTGQSYDAKFGGATCRSKATSRGRPHR